jgi:sugar transferase (PEP-CTERM/EpsH1 system associated)
MKELLFLVHRVPYPPNKGDKIRSFNILKFLANRYRVHLGAFVDDPLDWHNVDSLRQICVDTCLVALSPLWAKWHSLNGFMRRQPLTLSYYRNAELQDWVDSTFDRREVDKVLVYSSAMAQYVVRHLDENLCSVIDFVDVDSEKWRQYSERKAWPMSWVYRREHEYLLQYERKLASKFTKSVFVSKAESALFQSLVPEVAARVTHISNGVDAEYFSPNRSYPNPYARDEKVLVFTGAMDYWANVDAVVWFACDIFPKVLASIPASHFYIVGANPVAAVRDLAGRPGIHVTGRVSDVRPYVRHACAAVVPLRIARGLQNKVLEAMAMAKPVIATSHAIAGIELPPSLQGLVADKPNELAEKAIELLSTDGHASLRIITRRHVLRHHNWNQQLERFELLLQAADNVQLQ